MGFDELVAKARKKESRNLVIVGAHEAKLLKAVARAVSDGLAAAILLGDSGEIFRIAETEGIDLTSYTIEHIPDPHNAAEAAMEMVRGGTAGALMKGKITTSELMHIALASGLRREGRLLSHISGIEHPVLGKDKLILLTDAGLVTYPTLAQRVQIIRNAVDVMRCHGVSNPHVAALSLSEGIDNKIPSSVDAAKLKEMNSPGGELEDIGVIDGPLDLFSALDANSAALKGIESTVAGRADILHCSDAVCGNAMSKAIIYFAKDSRTGGCVVGGTVPVILLSRASSADDKYYSILMGLSCSSE